MEAKNKKSKNLIMQQNEELLKHAEEMQSEARRIIDELGIFNILKRISEPSLIGSIENGLMVWRDIDINAYMKKVELEKVLDLLKEFALLPTIQKVQFSNFRELRRDHIKSKRGFPKGYYIGLRSIQPSGEWKIDIWFGEKGIDINDYEISNSLVLTDKQKIAILRIKKAWLDEQSAQRFGRIGSYKDEVTSVDIYKAVLEHGIMNEDGFKNYIKESVK